MLAFPARKKHKTIINTWYCNKNLFPCALTLYRAHCLYRDLNDKRPGASSDNNFIFKKINKN